MNRSTDPRILILLFSLFFAVQPALASDAGARGGTNGQICLDNCAQSGVAECRAQFGLECGIPELGEILYKSCHILDQCDGQIGYADAYQASAAAAWILGRP